MKAIASDNIQDLKGIGLEYYVDKSGIIWDFFNGNLITLNAGNVDDTLV